MYNYLKMYKCNYYIQLPLFLRQYLPDLLYISAVARIGKALNLAEMFSVIQNRSKHLSLKTIFGGKFADF